MIKNLFLDLDDTLLDFQKGERAAISEAFHQLGIGYDESTIERYMEINLACWQALERGEMTKDQVLFGRFERLFLEMGIEASVNDVQEIYEKLLATQHDFVDGARELLEELYASGKYRLYMATNGIPSVQKPRISDSGIGKYFDGIFISEEIGYAKPKREFFEGCFARIEDFRPEQTLIVGDSLTSDILGGINAGIRTCHFNKKDKPYDSIIPDYKINKLSELTELLDRIE